MLCLNWNDILLQLSNVTNNKEHLYSIKYVFIYVYASIESNLCLSEITMQI